MKKTKLLNTSEDYVIFVDSKDENNIYCMTEEVFKEKTRILEKYDRKEENVPDKYTIKVFPIGKVGEKDSYTDIYDIISDKTIDFPINRIKFKCIRFVHNQ